MCSDTPRFSYPGPKTAVNGVSAGTHGAGGWCTTGSWVGGPGVVPTHPAGCCEVPNEECTHRRQLAAVGAGGIGGRPQGVRRRRGRSWYHPPGPVRSLQDPPCTRTSQIAASWPITARFDLNFSKVKQNGRVSLKYVEKAYVSPCSQNGLQMSPLEIPGFPYLLAFSPKELMGLF